MISHRSLERIETLGMLYLYLNLLSTEDSKLHHCVNFSMMNLECNTCLLYTDGQFFANVTSDGNKIMK